MTSNLKLKMSIAAVALAFSAPAAAFNLVQIDFSGTGNVDNAVIANNLDWAQANVLFQNILPTPDGGATTDFNLLGQGTGQFKFNAVDLTPGTLQITYVFGVPATATRTTIGTTDTIAYISTLGGGYFKAYIDSSINANALAGTGFTDGELLFEGVFNAQTDLSVLTNGRSCVGTATCANLDQFEDDDLGGVKTTVIGGSTAFTIDLTYQNTDYIINNITTFSVSMNDQTFNTSTLTPFKEVDPSKLFQNVDFTGTVAPVYGTSGGVKTNGTCPAGTCDIHVQGDASSAFDADAIVPEPGSLALLGIGLGGLGFAAMRRRRKA